MKRGTKNERGLAAVTVTNVQQQRCEYGSNCSWSPIAYTVDLSKRMRLRKSFQLKVKSCQNCAEKNLAWATRLSTVKWRTAVVVVSTRRRLFESDFSSMDCAALHRREIWRELLEITDLWSDLLQKAEFRTLIFWFHFSVFLVTEISVKEQFISLFACQQPTFATKGFQLLSKLNQKRENQSRMLIYKNQHCVGEGGAQLLQALFGLQQIFAVQQARPGILSTVQYKLEQIHGNMENKPKIKNTQQLRAKPHFRSSAHHWANHTSGQRPVMRTITKIVTRHLMIIDKNS